MVAKTVKSHPQTSSHCRDVTDIVAAHVKRLDGVLLHLKHLREQLRERAKHLLVIQQIQNKLRRYGELNGGLGTRVACLCWCRL